jgi:biofilm protein TabA
MIIDTLENASQYFLLNPLFKTAFDYLKTNNLDSLEVGITEIQEGLKMIVFDEMAKTKEESLSKFECHNQNIDIQICLKGTENIGWKPRQKCKNPIGEYDAEKDVLFYNDDPDMFFQLNDNQFAIFYPNDVHAPMIGDGSIRKIVFKVKI